MTYKNAGVNIDAADSLVEKIKPLIKKTETAGVLGSIGHYAGLFSLANHSLKEPVLCASTDGVGTKLKLAIQYGDLTGLGQDLVAMSANDILCLGAKPLFFLDYYATGRLDPDSAFIVVEGIARACREIGCALIGGETAEMPSLYQEGDFDLAGFIIGIVEKKKIIDGNRIRPGDAVIGIASSGPHSNGYSLIRRVIEEKNLSLKERYEGLSRSLGDTLLEPTKLYGNLLLPLLDEFAVGGIAHITGGGFHNIPRILPEATRVVIKRNAWTPPPIFSLIREWGALPQEEMELVFNMGIGLVVTLDSKKSSSFQKKIQESGERCFVIGEVAPRRKGEEPLLIV